MSAANWDEQYRAGHWNYLANLPEMGRYALVAGCIQSLLPGGSILDVGCGEGILLRHLAAANHYDYTGVDLSQVAIAKAVARYPHQRWFTSSADQFVDPSERKYDVLIFNEVLYYLDDPAATLDRYRLLLRPRGILLVSMFVPPAADAAWKLRVDATWSAIDPQRWERLDEWSVWSANAQIGWRVAAFQTASIG